MSFPTISVTHSFNDSNAMSHVVTLPASISAGDLIFIWIGVDGAPALSGPGGWDIIISEHDGGGQTVDAMCVAKVMTGTEGGTTVTFTTDGNEQSSWIIGQIPAATWYGSIDGIEGTKTDTSTSDDSPDPPSHTATWGSADNLWIACFAQDALDTVSAYPYADNNTTENTGKTSGATVGLCTYDTAAQETQDPDTFTTSATEQWITATLVIRPATVSGTTIVVPTGPWR